MALITATSLTSGSDSAAATTHNTASITPSSNKLVIVAVAYRGSMEDPSLSGCGITWNTIYIRETSLSLFWGYAASPSTGALTFTWASDDTTTCVWSVVEFSNTYYTDPIVQYSFEIGTGTSGVATLASFQSTTNATYGCFRRAVFEANSPGSGFTELHDVQDNAPDITLQTEWKNSNDTTVDASWVTSSSYLAVGVEIRNADSPPGGGLWAFF